MNLEAELVSAANHLEETIENHVNKVKGLEEKYKDNMHKLEVKLTAECAQDVIDEETRVTKMFEETIEGIHGDHKVAVADIHADHATATEEALALAKEKKDKAVAAKTKELNDKFTIDLKNALDKK